MCPVLMCSQRFYTHRGDTIFYIEHLEESALFKIFRILIKVQKVKGCCFMFDCHGVFFFCLFMNFSIMMESKICLKSLLTHVKYLGFLGLHCNVSILFPSSVHK